MITLGTWGPDGTITDFVLISHHRYIGRSAGVPRQDFDRKVSP